MYENRSHIRIQESVMCNRLRLEADELQTLTESAELKLQLALRQHDDIRDVSSHCLACFGAL